MSLPINVVWKPIPNSSQEFALDTRCDHTLYHGARGPGKTITQLMRFRRRVGMGYGEFWRGVIFDREFKNLSDIIAQSRRFFPKFKDGARFLSSQSDLKWVWPSGEELLFRHIKKASDYDNFHGHEYPFIGWNELTKYPTSELYDKLMSTNRSSFSPLLDTPVPKNTNGGPAWTRSELEQMEGKGVQYDTPDGKPLPPIPLEVFSTTNPNGPGHNWVKRRFINGVKPGQIVRTETEVFNPQTQQDEVIVRTQVAIFGSYRENIYLDPKYVASLNEITDENLKRAWLYGDWDVNAGGALDDLWRSNVHVLPRFRIPSHWRVDRTFDWGSSHPFSVGWWAEANGEEVEMINDRGVVIGTFCPPRGTLIQIAEWYGTKTIGTNQGLKMSARDVAIGIRNREIAMLENGWIEQQPFPGPADNQIDNVTEKETETIAKKMADEGVRWTKSDKAKGSRKIGLQLARDMLQASVSGEKAGLYFMQNCTAAIEILPSLPRDEEDLDDIDTDAEDHPWDMTRYRVLNGSNRAAKKLKLSFAT